MTYNTTYIALRLMRCGLWDEALTILPSGATALRAELLTDHFWWRLDGQAEAEQAVAALYEEDGLLAAFLDSQLAYTRLLFDRSPRPGDLARARDGFDSAARDQRLAGWGLFWRGVTADSLEKDEAAAAGLFAQALAAALRDADPLLESYALRHQGGHAMESDAGRETGLDLLRRSYHLRAALGARPQTAAAAAALAEVLPPESTERGHLLQTAAATARELNLTWLESALDR
ncbi:MAG TPA: hypothetical protein VF060_17195 [Trebonia sp.]